MLDVDTMKLNAIGPRERSRFEKMPDLVIVDIHGENLVRSFGHELLAEVRADESTSADHANGDRLYRVAIKIHSG